VKTYADSSALVPLYVTEQFSEAAESALRPAGQIPFTVIHELEVPNAFERLIGRRLMTRDESRVIHRQLQEDLEHRRLVPIVLDLDRVFRAACDLSTAYAATHLARSLDLLHVAAARAAACTTFVSADERQLSVARASGLKVVDITRGTRRQKR
jgi:predicted nucleic acid-binding protein